MWGTPKPQELVKNGADVGLGLRRREIMAR